MKLKLLLLDDDKSFKERFSKVIKAGYDDKLELYCFSQKELAEEEIKKTRFDIVLVNSNIDFQPEENRKYVFAYLSDREDIETIGEFGTIYKYQKVDQIYNDIWSAYVKNCEGILVNTGAIYNGCKTILFTSPCGGVGTSALAVSYAMGLAMRSHQVAYINLNAFDDIKLYLDEEDKKQCMSDVISAIKSKKKNLAVLFESYANTGPFGLRYFNSARYTMDMLEFTPSEKLDFIKTMATSNNYEYLIIDYNCGFDAKGKEVLELCNQVYLVSNSTDSSNLKISNYLEAIKTIDETNESRLHENMAIVYNLNSSLEDRNKRLAQDYLKVCDHISYYKYLNIKQLLDKLSIETVKLLGE